MMRLHTGLFTGINRCVINYLSMQMVKLLTPNIRISRIGSICSNWKLIPKMTYNLLLTEARNNVLILTPRKRNWLLLIPLRNFFLSSSIVKLFIVYFGDNVFRWMKWKYLIESIAKSASKKFGSLCRVIHQNIYKSTHRSYIEFCCTHLVYCFCYVIRDSW